MKLYEIAFDQVHNRPYHAATYRVAQTNWHTFCTPKLRHILANF